MKKNYVEIHYKKAHDKNSQQNCPF